MAATPGGCRSLVLALVAALLLAVVPSTAPTLVLAQQAADCLGTRSGGDGNAAWIVVVSALDRDGRCASDMVIEQLTACLARIGDPDAIMADPGVRAELLDCVKAVLPGAAPTGGVTFGGALGGVFAREGQRPAASVTCAEGGPNPDIADGGDVAGEFFKAAKAGIIFGGYAPIFQEYLEARTEAYLNGEQSTPRLEEAKQNLELATEAAAAAGELPDNDSLGAALWLVSEILDWFTNDEDEDEGRPLPGAPSTCDDIRQFLDECGRSGWQGGPCGLFLDRFNNPNCDPLVALTDGDRACQVRAYSDAEIADAVARAETRCWALVNPGPDGSEVCRLTLPTREGVLMRDPTSVCGDPRALLDQERCLADVLDPAAVAATLLGDRLAILDLHAGIPEFGQGPPIPPGPE